MHTTKSTSKIFSQVLIVRLWMDCFKGLAHHHAAKASLQPPTADDEEKPTDNDVVEEDEEVVDQQVHNMPFFKIGGEFVQMNTTETVTRKIAITTPLMRATKSVDMQRAPPEFEFLTEHPNHLPAVDMYALSILWVGSHGSRTVQRHH